jgi:hypothetical protein
MAVEPSSFGERAVGLGVVELGHLMIQRARIVLGEPGDPVGGEVDREQLREEGSRMLAHAADVGGLLGLPMPHPLAPQGEVAGEHSAGQRGHGADQRPGQRGSRPAHQITQPAWFRAPAQFCPVSSGTAILSRNIMAPRVIIDLQAACASPATIANGVHRISNWSCRALERWRSHSISDPAAGATAPSSRTVIDIAKA